MSATAGIAAGKVKITVIARHIEEGAGPYIGHLMAKEIARFASGTTGDYPVELPADFPYRLLLIKALITANTPQAAITKAKISCDADAFIPVNDWTEDLVDMNEQRFGYAEQDVVVFAGDDESEFTDIYDIKRAFACPAADENLTTIEAIAAETVQFGCYTFSAPSTPALVTDDKSIPVYVAGNCPHACICIPFGDMLDPDSWFDARVYGSVKLSLTQAVGAACSIVIQQLKV
ncbi:hypothetical protein ES703_123194 [subsurface metagenome]